MRALVAVLLAGLMLVPPASAIHDRPIQPAEQPARAFREAIFDVNETITRIEDQIGDHPKYQSSLDQARNKLVSAAEGHNSGNHWLSMSRLLEAVAIARKAQVQYENRQASDPDAAYFADMESKWRESRGMIKQYHERMLDLQSAGIDLWTLDHALLAGSIATEGESLHKSWNGIAKSWDRGQRGDKMKNALAAFSYGVILYMDVAQQIVTKAIQNHPEETIGPVVGNATLEGVMDSLQPIVKNRSVSFDRQLTSIINGNIAEEEWLAALGSVVAWSQKQAPAAVQHRLDEPDKQFPTEAVVSHLRNLTEEDHTLEDLDKMGVAGAQARYSLSQAAYSLRIVLNQTERDEGDTRTTLQAAEGLGALSAAHTSQAILELASGGDPPENVIHLPVSNVGEFALGPGANDEGGDEDEASAGSWWMWVATASVLGLIAVAVRRKRR